MRIETKFQDVLEVHESDILTFGQGLPGFEDEKKFIMLPIEDTGLSLLQSIQTKELAFIITDPFLFFKEYDFELSAVEREILDIKDEKDVNVQVIITVADPYEKSTANLQAPVILNIGNNKCKQIILSDGKYKTKHFLTEALTIQEG
jgi:flagellar assembly factor FliW